MTRKLVDSLRIELLESKTRRPVARTVNPPSNVDQMNLNKWGVVGADGGNVGLKPMPTQMPTQKPRRTLSETRRAAEDASIAVAAAGAEMNGKAGNA